MISVNVAIAASASLLVSAASGGPETKSARGGTYTVGWESSFGWTNSFDPTGEYLANAFAINTNLLLRGLIGYNHVGGPAGAKIVPDLATKVPKPTRGGTRYTFTIKNGVRFGPPVNRQITSADVRTAIAQSVDTIVETVKRTLEETPPELASDLGNAGIVLAGGGALLRGLDRRLAAETGLPVQVAEAPLECVVLGAGSSLEERAVIDRTSRRRSSSRHRRRRRR